MPVTKPEVHNSTRPDAPLPFVFTFYYRLVKLPSMYRFLISLCNGETLLSQV